MLRYAGKSDKGLLRSHNEDAFCLIGGADGAPLLLAVADGMGGHLAGDIASQTAISVIRESLAADPLAAAADNDAINARLFSLVDEANAKIYKKSLYEPGCYGMGTTLIVAVISGGRLTISHVGDSCAYYLRDGKMNKITTDHTYVEELVRIGTLTRDEAARHPKRNVITKVVGCMSEVEADFYEIELLGDDRILICTDGLSKMLTEYEIAEAVMAADNPDDICGTLITKSNHRGGLDNITALVCLYAA